MDKGKTFCSLGIGMVLSTITTVIIAKEKSNLFRAVQKNIGGFLGAIGISGAFPQKWSARLVLHQWLGMGTKPAFGFGQYVIPEIQDSNPLTPLTKHSTLLKKTIDAAHLLHLLENMDASASSGPDGITVSATSMNARLS